MSYGNTEFLEDIMDTLGITPPGTGEYDVRECAELAMEEIDRLQMRDKMFAFVIGAVNRYRTCISTVFTLTVALAFKL